MIDLFNLARVQATDAALVEDLESKLKREGEARLQVWGVCWGLGGGTAEGEARLQVGWSVGGGETAGGRGTAEGEARLQVGWSGGAGRQAASSGHGKLFAAWAAST